MFQIQHLYPLFLVCWCQDGLRHYLFRKMVEDLKTGKWLQVWWFVFAKNIHYFQQVSCSPCLSPQSSPPERIDPILQGFLWISYSMDWFKEKSWPETIDFPHSVWGFPVTFPLSQSVELYPFSVQFTSIAPNSQCRGRWLDPLPAALAPLRDCLGPRAPKGAAAQFTKDRAHRLLQRMKCGWADAGVLGWGLRCCWWLKHVDMNQLPF